MRIWSMTADQIALCGKYIHAVWLICWLCVALQVPCEVGQTSCECPVSASECEFDLTINYLQTFASYSVGDDGSIDPLDGYIYTINSSGQVCVI